jgi:CheY-like chemotaxis protein
MAASSEFRAENVRGPWQKTPNDSLPVNSTNGSAGQERYIKITVEDQGVGIPEKYLQKIFDPYFTTKQEGSGLGLATTYSIITKHDGYITVDSKLGVGTTFTIYLPASDQSLADQAKAGEEKPFVGEGKVLVMDDEEQIQEGIGRMLRHLGYAGVFAKDGAEAIELYKKAKEKKQPFDAVIMDLTIPGGMGGQEAIKQLLEIDPRVKAIASSGYSNNAVMADYKRYGFQGLIAKPHTIQELSRALHNVLRAP